MPYKILFYSLVFFTSLSVGYAETYESFTEPEQSIDIAAPEVGVLASVEIKEGDQVKKGQVLARLDIQVLNAALAVAKARHHATGKIKASKALQSLHQNRLNRLLPLLARGAAQQAEIDQARSEFASAKANVQAAREARKIYALEAKQIQAKIEQRTLRSPINGVVTTVYRDPAELVTTSGEQALILTIAQVQPLQIVIHVPTPVALELVLGQKLAVEFTDYPIKQAEAEVKHIAPITDAGSDTVKIRLQLPNEKNQLRSGIKVLVNNQ
jgi:RND family efflux transporter MFP subunit